jgi:hypothetical protein
MKLIPALLIVGMLAVSGCSKKVKKIEPYSPELVKKAEAAEEAESTAEEAIASLTDPKKLATLKGERAVNPRFQKCLYWMMLDEQARFFIFGKKNDEGGVCRMVKRSIERNGPNIDSGYVNMIGAGLLLNFRRAKDYGLYTSEGMKELRQGKSATITKGEYAGQEATADHIIPLSVCPELQNQIFNLQLLPASLNSSKGNKVEMKQVEFARELNRAGLLSAEGLESVKKASSKGNKVEMKQVEFARELNRAGLLSAEGLESVKKAYEKESK